MLVHVDMAQALPAYYIKTGFSGVKYDFLSFSSHKIYSSEYQCGCLVVKNQVLLNNSGEGGLSSTHGQFGGGFIPPHVGGGQVIFATPNNVEGSAFNGVIYKKDLLNKSAGTPNVPAVVALAKTLTFLQTRNLESLFETKRKIVELIYDELNKIAPKPEIPTGRILTDIITTKDSPMVTFRVFVDGIRIPPRRISKFFGEHGIETRAGCFCAYSYIANHLLYLDKNCISNYIDLATNAKNEDDLLDSPIGYVRVSPGLFNTLDDAYLFINVWREWLKSVKLA